MSLLLNRKLNMEKLLGFIGTMAVAVLVSLLATVIVRDYIEWFVQPIFDIPKLTFGQIFGLLAFYSLLSVYIKEIPKHEEGTEIKTAITNIIAKTFLLLFGWGLGYIYYLIIY